MAVEDLRQLPGLQQALTGALRDDTGFLIWTALNWSGESPERIGARIDFAELSQWLSTHLIGALVSADNEDCFRVLDRHRCRWNQLLARSLSMPVGERLERAAVWLEVTGPTVPTAWQAGWPKMLAGEGAEEPGLAAAAACGDAYRDDGLDVKQLAFTVSRSKQWASRFHAALQDEKQAAVHQLAYGLTHEINNPLANISARAQTLLRDESAPDRRRALLQIEAQAQRAFAMLADLMYVARPRAAQPAEIDLFLLTRDIAAGHRGPAAERSIELSGPLEPAEPVLVYADGDQIGDCLDALVRNAIEAVGEGGLVDLRLESSSDSIAVVIADNGPGLSDRDRRHAFDPYYSGREAGRGLGMGLARANVLAQQNGATLSFDAFAPGCVVRLEFPPNLRR